jgi:hypothetical protein
VALVENSGHMVSKDELLKQVWPDSSVEGNNLTANTAPRNGTTCKSAKALIAFT